MKIGMVQIRPLLGDLEGTMRKVLERIREAGSQGVSVLCFPEMALTGYTLSPDEALLAKQDRLLEEIRQEAEALGMTVLIGGIEKEAGQYYIVQHVIGSDVRRYRKMHPGEKESRVYGAGTVPGLFEVDGLRFGILLCYDSRFPELAQCLALAGAEVLFIPTASPNRCDKRIAMWKKYLVARAYDNRVNVAATNLLFPEQGGGMIGYDKSGELLFERCSEEEGLLVFEPDRRTFDNQSMTRRDFLAEKRERLKQSGRLDEIEALWFGSLGESI